DGGARLPASRAPSRGGDLVGSGRVPAVRGRCRHRLPGVATSRSLTVTLRLTKFRECAGHGPVGLLPPRRRAYNPARITAGSGLELEGGSMPLPILTDEQRKQALAKAAEARKARAELKAQLKSEKMTLRDVLSKQGDDVVGKMKVSSVLESLPGVGKVRARK